MKIEILKALFHDDKLEIDALFRGEKNANPVKNKYYLKFKLGGENQDRWKIVRLIAILMNEKEKKRDEKKIKGSELKVRLKLEDTPEDEKEFQRRVYHNYWHSTADEARIGEHTVFIILKEDELTEIRDIEFRKAFAKALFRKGEGKKSDKSWYWLGDYQKTKIEFIETDSKTSISSNHFNNDLRITRIRIDENHSIWKTLYEQKKDSNNDIKIIGFEENTIYLWNKWRWDEAPDWVREERDQRLQIIHIYLQESINRLFEDISTNNKYFSKIIDFIKTSSFKDFRKAVVNNFIKGGDLFVCIQNVLWFSSEELDKMRKQDNEMWQAFYDFHLDFFRDKHPIFDIIIENVGDNNIVIHSASLDMRNPEVNMYPRAYGGTVLDIVAQYDWALYNYSDKKYNEWFNTTSRKHPYGFQDIYDGMLTTSFFELNPPLNIPPMQAVRFTVRFLKGYRWPCEMQFLFHFNNDLKTVSEWYRFIPTSHPEVNIYS